MTKSKKKVVLRGFTEYLTPTFVVVCGDAIVAEDQSVSLIRLMDEITGLIFPIQLTRFLIVVEFVRNLEIDVKEFLEAELCHKIVLTTPSGNSIDLDIFPERIDSKRPWITTRSLTDISGRLSLVEPGAYRLSVLVKTKHSDFVEVLHRNFYAKLSPGIAGVYKALFSADPKALDPKTAGEGLVVLMPDGTIQGGDGGYAYTGTYSVSEDSISGRINALKLVSDAESVFGKLGNFELSIKGVVKERVLHLEGRIKDKPSNRLWIRLQRQTTKP